MLLSLFHCRLDPAHVLATKCGSHFRKHLPAILPFPQATLPFPQSSRRSNVHGSHLRWQVQPRCAPVQTSSARTLRAPPATSRSVRADSSVRMLQGLLINNAPATRKGRCRTGASRVYRYQDGESLIRIADRDSDRCKPITSSTWHAHAHVNAHVNICMSQCKDDAQVHAVVRIVAAPARA